MGSVRGPWIGRRRGRSPHQGDGRARPDPLGQFDADIEAARTRACERGLAVRIQSCLGKGKRFFSDGTPPSGLALASTNSVSSDVLISTYTPAGPLRTGFLDDAAA